MIFSQPIPTGPIWPNPSYWLKQPTSQQWTESTNRIHIHSSPSWTRCVLCIPKSNINNHPTLQSTITNLRDVSGIFIASLRMMYVNASHTNQAFIPSINQLSSIQSSVFGKHLHFKPFKKLREWVGLGGNPIQRKNYNKRMGALQKGFLSSQCQRSMGRNMHQ